MAKRLLDIKLLATIPLKTEGIMEKKEADTLAIMLHEGLANALKSYYGNSMEDHLDTGNARLNIEIHTIEGDSYVTH